MPAATDQVLQKEVRNAFQNAERAAALCSELIGVDLLGALNPEEGAFLRTTFEKRHPITHNLGIVGRKYLERVRTGELEGRDLPTDGADVGRAIELSLRVLEDVQVREKVRWFFDDRARQLESPAYDVTFSRRASLEPREMFRVMTIEPRWGKQGSGSAPESFKALAAELERGAREPGRGDP